MINCNCNYIKFSDGQIVHSINCEKSNLFNLENRHGFASLGIIDVKKDYELIKQQVEKLQESNRILKEALEFISTLDNKELVGQEIKDLPKTIAGITAREALNKTEEV